MPNPICIQCSLEMKPIRNSFKAISLNILDFEPYQEPYQVQSGDKFKCPKCEIEIVTSFPKQPLFEHFENDFDKNIESIKKTGNFVEYY